MKFKAVLFDLDGVLIDSPPIHAWAWAEMFRPYGIVLPPERLHREEGRRSEEIAAGILEEFGLHIPEPELANLLGEKRRRYREASPKGMRTDSKAAIHSLRSLGIKIALVSGSALENVEGVLTRDDLSLFDALITAEEYIHGKPDPEPYITGCQRLDVSPADAAAVENAPLGIRSAKAAGLYVIAVATTLPGEELQEANVVIADPSGLLALLITK